MYTFLFELNVFFSLTMSFKKYALLTPSKEFPFSSSFKSPSLAFVDLKISGIYKSMHFLLSTLRRELPCLIEKGKRRGRENKGMIFPRDKKPLS